MLQYQDRTVRGSRNGVDTRADSGLVNRALSQGRRESSGVTATECFHVAVGRCGCLHAVGAGGVILHRPGHTMSLTRTSAQKLGLWRQQTPVGENLHGIALGPPHVAVGAAGTVVER